MWICGICDQFGMDSGRSEVEDDMEGERERALCFFNGVVDGQEAWSSERDSGREEGVGGASGDDGDF